jgi:hypothetical protein
VLITFFSIKNISNKKTAIKVKIDIIPDILKVKHGYMGNIESKINPMKKKLVGSA